MAEGQTTGAGAVCWTELMTPDLERAKKFYSELIGWRFQEQNIGGMRYIMFTPPGAEQPIGGMMAMEGPQWAGIPPHWLSYIMVANVDDRARRVTELGGQIKVPPTDIPDIGRFCVIADPTGAVIALFQSKR
ncbi:MAG: VOC family protein [Planctomycetota bacterium]